MFDFYSYTRYIVSGGLGIGQKGYRIGDPMLIPFANDYFRPIGGMYGVMELQPGQVNWGTVNPQPYPGAVRLWLWSVFAGGSDFSLGLPGGSEKRGTHFFTCRRVIYSEFDHVVHGCF